MLSNDHDVLLRAEDVSKRFQLGQFVSLASSLRSLHRMTSNPLAFWRRAKERPGLSRLQIDNDGSKYLWAVRNVNMQVRRGERIAVLGRNGAGKSTLLKLLVGIMQPTEGQISCNARIVPLLGVGAGFDPELTGRENVHLNGVVLGLHPTEIRKRMNAIIEFSEIPEFMDTPLKRFSKGMRARLGIAVAVNVMPDILVVDEVLAVGDLGFRTKCMERIQAMCSRGMALLFVSHSPSRVKALCERAVLMRDGLVVEDGECARVARRYLKEDVGEVGNADAIAAE